jgi:hypothetical protein
MNKDVIFGLSDFACAMIVCSGGLSPSINTFGAEK